MTTTPFILALLIPLALYGCVASEPVQVHYDPAIGLSSYESRRIVMGYRAMSAGLASNQRVMWQALASCSGQNCTPDEVTLAFYNDTSKDLNLDYRRLQLTVDGITHDWQDLGRETEPAHYTVPPGEFIRVSLARAAFVRLARAQQVEVLLGESGTSVFSVSFAHRAGFRAFAAALGLEE